MGHKAQIKDKLVYVDTHTGEEYEIVDYETRNLSSLVSNSMKIRLGFMPFDDYFKKIHETVETNSHVKLKKKSVFTFESTLTNKQIRLVQDFFNKYIAVEPLSEKDMKDWLADKKSGIKVKNIRFLSYFLFQLSIHNYICSNYVQVATFNGTFVNKHGGEIAKTTIKVSCSIMAKKVLCFEVVKNELFNYIKDIEQMFKTLKML